MVVDAQRSKKNKEDHSSESREKCAQKGFDRADIVRDVRFRDLPGLDRVPWHNPKNDAQEKTSTRSRCDAPDVLRLGARNLQLSVTSLRLVPRLARAAVQRESRIIPSKYIHRLLALFALLLVRFRLESLPVCQQIAVAAILAGKE